MRFDYRKPNVASHILTLQLSTLDRIDVAMDGDGLVGHFQVALFAQHDQIVQRILVLFLSRRDLDAAVYIRILLRDDVVRVARRLLADGAQHARQFAIVARRLHFENRLHRRRVGGVQRLADVLGVLHERGG